jgi:hypothetical protein
MKLNDIYTEEKVRLDPKCWTGKKIGNPKTKMKGGVRVNNCVPAESIEEGSQDTAPKMGSKEKKLAQGALKGARDMTAALGLVRGKDGVARPPETKKKGVAEGSSNIGTSIKSLYQKIYNAGDDEIEYFYNDSPIFAQYWDEYEGDLNSIIAEIDPEELQLIHDELESYAQQAGLAEDLNPEYNDEAGMADNNLETLERAVRGIDDLIQSGDNLPEWCQEKIAVAKSMLVSVWDYMYSEEASDEVDPEIDAMFEAMEQLVSEMAQKNRVSEDLVWESFEALPDNVLYETAAWRRKEGKSKKGGLNAKGVASYRRENPGSKLQMAVTTKPSKLKKGSKAAKRRKSFCARMSGVKGPMKKPNGKPTRKALALRKWNC